MIDPETIAAYDARVEDYVALVSRGEPGRLLLSFMAQLTPGGHVLDLGCGPGNASAQMRDRGLVVDPVDASAAMVDAAMRVHGLKARMVTFDEIEGVALYDGVWANFSLVHAPRERFGPHLQTLATALRESGVLHLGLKLGTGEKRDRLGRLYTFFEEAEIAEQLKAIGFRETFKSFGEEPGLAGTVEPWIAVQAVKL